MNLQFRMLFRSTGKDWLSIFALLPAVFWIGAVFDPCAQAGEHLLFQSRVDLDYSGRYQIFLSLFLHEEGGEWKAFEIRRAVEKTISRGTHVYSRDESVQKIEFPELISLGERGFPLFTIPGSTTGVLFLKIIDPDDPGSTLGISYPVDARPWKKQWGWLSLSIARTGSAFHLVDCSGAPYEWIDMKINYRNFGGTRPVGMRIFKPQTSNAHSTCGTDLR
jgi:hypothetical protein